MGKDKIALQSWVLNLLESGRFPSSLSIAKLIGSLYKSSSFNGWDFTISDDGTITADNSGSSSKASIAIGPISAATIDSWRGLGYTKLTFDVSIKSDSYIHIFALNNNSANTSTKYYELVAEAGDKTAIGHGEIPLSSVSDSIYIYHLGGCTTSNWFVS